VALYVRPLVLLFLLDAMCFTILQCETLCWDFQQELGTRIRELELGVADRRNQRQEREAVLSQKRARRDQCVGRLQEIDNVKTRLLQALKDTGAQGVFDAYRWVESHRNDFQKEVYGPVLLEVPINSLTSRS
jgi:hypothetical protein